METEVFGISARRIIFWGGFLGIVVAAISVYWKPEFLSADTPVGVTRAVLFFIWVLFTGYSIYCIPKESLFESAKRILSLHWGRQVTADLYISALLSIALVWLVTQSMVETLLWGLAIIPYVNLVILLFIILHLDQIMLGFGLL
jgi:hypothetical protein